MTDRDHFAAAALTGLVANGDYSVESTPLLALRMADAMLRERERRAPKILNSGEYGPEWHAAAPNLDAAPAARAQTDADSDRTDKAVLRPGEGTGDTPVPYSRTDEKRGDSPAIRDTTPMRKGTPSEGSEPREGTEPVAWAVRWDGYDGIDCEFVYQEQEEAQSVAGGQDGANVVPLYRSPPYQGFSQKNLTLASDERDAMLAMAAYLDTRGNIQMQAWGSLLRILERRLA